MQVKEELNVRILEELNRDIGDVALNLRKFIKDNIVGFKKKGAVLGVSGGIDSAVALTLCV